MRDSSNGSGRRVLLCVTGGIAAYKAPDLVRQLIRANCEVQVLVTTSGLAFVSALALTTVSGRPVRTDLLDASEEGRVGHIELADWADIVVVAPATAHVMAAAAHGLAGDLVTTCLLATRAPVLFAPAMNSNMWRHPATQANLQCLRSRGCHTVGPDAGELACGWTGEGRMSDPGRVVEAVLALLDPPSPALSSWRGRKILVSAGPTRTYLDPVRFLTNASSGAMGFAIARAAARIGAEVTLVSGPVNLPTPQGVRRLDVETADEMLLALDGELRSGAVDCMAMVAAVSDFSAPAVAAKSGKDELLQRLRKGVLSLGTDVLATLTSRYAAKTYFLGFGAQTVDDSEADVASALEVQGRQKLEQKGCHALFVNRVGLTGQGFGSTENTGLLLLRASEGPAVEVRDAGPPMAKDRLALWLLEHLAQPARRHHP